MNTKLSIGKVIIVTFLFSSFTTYLSYSQDWLDTDWQYRNTVFVANPVGETLSDFQVEISLDDAFDFTKPLSDGTDIRFTESNGTTLIPFWIESWDNIGENATIWIKASEIPVEGTSLFMYYGNPEATITLPDPVETPPIGPFTRDPSNPISPIGDSGGGASLLAENIVFDDVTGHYWMVFANYRGSSPGVGLVWSDNPADASTWNWFGNVYTHTSGGSFAPHIIKEDGLWYIFFARWPNIVYMISPNIDGIYSEPTIVLSPSEVWEAYRVDEPYVFQRNDGKWIMIYMADAGGVTEQVGYASADDITGPYTKFENNPCLAFGPPGSFDAGTIADPWVYEFEGIYYIGYTVSPTKNSPWQTALATTADWIEFTKQGVIFPLAPSGWDAVNSFRGAVTRVEDIYVFSYTGDGYRMGIATQPVFMTPEVIINNGDAVFDFFDGFDGDEIDLTNWSFAYGNLGQTLVENGNLTLTSISETEYVKIVGQETFGMDYIGETMARHPNQGTLNMIAEMGFADASWNTVRIVDDFPSVTNWQRQANIAGQQGPLIDMAVTADQNWHVFKTFRENSGIVGFQIDDNTVEYASTFIPITNLPPFLMSYGIGNQFLVDWTRVRKWAGIDPETYVVPEGGELTVIELHTPILCFGGYSNVTIIATGGAPPYTGTGSFIQYAGSETYTVTDVVGSMASVTLDLEEPDELIASYEASEILCNGGSSEVTIVAVGGTEPYSGTGVLTYFAGTYSYSVTDANGCTSELSIFISEPDVLEASYETTEIPYPGGSATVTISALGGTPPYTGVGEYSQSAGTTVYIVTDANGCTTDISVTLTDPSDWYDLNWSYRRTADISNPTDSDLNDFQVKITLDETFDFTKALSDGSDIRVTDIDKTTLIPFWIESWDPTEQSAVIWVKVPSIPTQGTMVYLYYGNPEPTIPNPTPIETPPIGPFTRAVGNPIIPTGDPGAGASLLAENIVYDDVTGHYWMVFANYRSGSQGVGLVWSDTPTDATSWNWFGNVYNHTGGGGSFAPHIIKEGGLWYIFFAKWPDIVYMTSPTIDGTYSATTIVLSPSEAWETYRVDEPYVFQRNDGKWIMMYMGDYGSAHEQIGFATADNITGPYAKYEDNPCIPFGPPGSFDAGTVADPWVYEFYGVYYIGYTVSPTTSSPWQTAVATTTDWQAFDRLGIIFPLASSGWDSNNCFRGAITRIGDEYVFSYTGDSYKMGIATQPVFMEPSTPINDGDAVFDFFDGFDDTNLDLSKWTITNGYVSQLIVENGLLSLNAFSTYIKINAQKSFGMNFMGETRAYHPTQGTQNLISEVGFADNDWNTVRIVDDFLLGTTYWQRQAKLDGQPDEFFNMGQAADQDWHIFHVYRESPALAGFQIDDNPAETTTGTANTSVPTASLPPFLMSYGNGNQFIADWTRVRKWIGQDPLISLSEEETIQIMDLKVFLEGAFNGTDMDTHLSDLNILPLIQPYDSEPWYYLGTETIPDSPDSEIVDWVLLELRDAPNASSAGSGTEIARQAALLLSNGRVVGPDGDSFVQFDVNYSQQLFLVIWHRNHLAIMSNIALTRNQDGIYNYDFTTSTSQAYGDGQNNLGNDTFGMIGGNIFPDRTIEELYDLLFWILSAGKSGYLNEDTNLDGEVNNLDKNDFWVPNIGKEMQFSE